ncbi:unnamed protein product, partial [marine sediment metagenome]
FGVGDGETTRSMMVKVGPDGKARTFELKDGEWAERELGDIEGCQGIKIVSPGDEEGKCIILRTLDGDDHEIIIEDTGLIRKEVKVVTTGDKKMTRSMVVKIGPDGKVHVVEPKGGEWIERDLDGDSKVKILRAGSGEGECVILCGPDAGDGEKVIKVVAGVGECCEMMTAGACCEGGAPCQGECEMQKGGCSGGASPCEGACGMKGRGWLDRPNPCDAASPLLRVRRGSMGSGSPCGGGSGACGQAMATPCEMECTGGTAAR